MKKTLVALAVLAASGATFAQATITGQYGYGFKQTTTGPATSSGLGVSDSNVVFRASEDLGGGLKASAQVKIDALNRAKIAGGDSNVSLSGGFGTLTMGLAETDYDTPDQFGTFMGATVLGGVANDSERISDFVKYATSFGPVGVSIQHSEAAADNGLGNGSAGSTKQRLNTVAASYDAGPLSVKADYSVYDNKDATGFLGFDTRTTLGGNYDLGVAKLGLGVQRTAWTQSASSLETFVGASGSFGPVDLGVDFVQNKIDGLDKAAGTTNQDKTYSGWGVQAKYNLSKRTLVRFRYNNFDAALANVDKTSSVALALYHNF